MFYSFCIVRAENDVGIGNFFYCHIGCCYNEARLGVKNVRDNDQNKYFMKVDDANNIDEFKEMQRQNNCNLVLKDVHETKQEKVSWSYSFHALKMMTFFEGYLLLYII